MISPPHNDRILHLASFLVLVGLILPIVAFAQAPSTPLSRRTDLDALRGTLRSGAAPQAARYNITRDGFLRFAGAPPGGHFAVIKSGSTAEEAASAFVEQWRALLAEDSNALAYPVERTQISGPSTFVRFGQTYGGVPVFAGEIVVQVTRGGHIAAVLSDTMRYTRLLDEGRLPMTPELDMQAAIEKAALSLQARYPSYLFNALAADLMLLDPAVVGAPGPVRLVWLTVVENTTFPVFVRDVVFVDAHNGTIVFHYPLIHDAKFREIYDADNTSADPGTLVRSEGDPPSGIADADIAYEYFGDTYDFYLAEHGRDSIDDAGAVLSATVRFCHPLYPCPFQNAFWDGSRMYFGEGFSAADDVVSHELTHGVTERTSNLVYANQSGAINESFSDMWGEWIDLTNTGGTDTPDVRWLLGEDIPGFGAIRDMQDPTTFGDPDRMGSPYFYTGTEDNGGVHTNSGVGNKLCYLLTDGDTFNGQTVTGLGVSQTADLFYECQVNLLTSGSDYADLYAALTQAAINLGLDQAGRDTVEAASLAVEIKPLPPGLLNFKAVSADGDPNVTLTWENPTDPGLQAIVIRRSTTTYPVSPTDGDPVYNGTGTSFVDGPLTVDTTYYYSAWAYYGNSSYSAVSQARAVAGQDPPDYFTEEFDLADNDLRFLTLTLVPDASSNGYVAYIEPSTVFPVDPSTGTVIPMNLDDYEQITLAGGQQVSLYGVNYSTFYIGSNGYITFTAGDTEYLPTLDAHFSLPRISALFDDFDLSSGGSVSWEQLADRAVVTWQNAPEYGTTNSNNFQVEMFFDGTIRITWLAVAASYGIAGISEGNNYPPDFVESDLSAYSFKDTDGDGLPDYWEVQHGLDPNSDTGNDGATGDPDSDGLTNIDEYNAGSDPQNPDSDGDGLSDGDEVHVYGTSPTKVDTDGDDYSDGDEVAAGTDPTDPDSYPPPGEIEVTDSVAPATDLAIPFGNVAVGLEAMAQVTITNTHLTNNLLIPEIELGGSYTENFDDGQAQGWTELLDSYWNVDSNEYHVNAGAPGVNMQSLYMGETFDDGTVSVQMRRTGSADAVACIALRATDNFIYDFPFGAGSAYLVGIFGDGSFIIMKFVNGGFDILDWNVSPYLSLGSATNFVEVTMTGPQIDVAFNGQSAWSGTDNSIVAAGRIGLVCDSGAAAVTEHFFDNVQSVSGSGGGTFRLENLPTLPVSLAPGGALTFDVYYAPNAVQTDSGSVTITSKDIDEPTVEVALTGSGMADDLVVTPQSGLNATGPPGGPFTPASETYTLFNEGTTTIPWTAATNAAWADATPSSGSLNPGESTLVQVALNGQAELLAGGSYTGMASFTNTNNSAVQTRALTLSVMQIPPGTVYWFPLDSDPGWARAGQWAFGTPTGQGGYFFGYPDPTSGATGSNVFGVNLNGDYYAGEGGPYYVVAGPFDCSNLLNVQLKFQRWLNTDFAPYATATIAVSNNGSSWTSVWSNGINEITDFTWNLMTYDISAVADGQATVYVRWGYSTAIDAFEYSGWNIDDIAIVADQAPLAEAWVDFAYAGTQTGTSAEPFNTLAGAVNALAPSGVIRIKGDTAVNWTSETPLLSTPMRIEAVNGQVRIGGSGP